ncbi:MAG: dihydroneopterin aldolase [Chitinophagales bacterium]|jgi:dihydroneopterin aldolase|nr:dihydroneopterin aldolase [Chitinophagales bacterium]
MIIALEGMIFHARIGYYDEEQLLRNKIEVSVEVTIDSNVKEPMDDIDTTINYENVYELIKNIVSEPSKLIESLVKKIILQIASGYPSAKSIKVRVAKINPPLSGQVERVWVKEEWVQGV